MPCLANYFQCKFRDHIRYSDLDSSDIYLFMIWYTYWHTQVFRQKVWPRYVRKFLAYTKRKGTFSQYDTFFLWPLPWQKVTSACILWKQMLETVKIRAPVSQPFMISALQTVSVSWKFYWISWPSPSEGHSICVKWKVVSCTLNAKALVPSVVVVRPLSPKRTFGSCTMIWPWPLRQGCIS